MIFAAVLRGSSDVNLVTPVGRAAEATFELLRLRVHSLFSWALAAAAVAHYQPLATTSHSSITGIKFSDLETQL